MPTKLVKHSKIKKHGSAVAHTILVVPTKRRIRHLTRDTLAGSVGPVSDVPIYTLETLAAGIAQTVFPGLRVIEEPILSLLFDQAVASSRDVLGYFKFRGERAQLPRGTFERIVHVVRKLKETGIYPVQLRAELSGCEAGEELKLEDVVTIYEVYEASLSNLHGVDPEGVFKALQYDCSQERFSSSFARLFPTATEISIDGFDEFTEPELGFIAKLCGVDADLSVVFDFQLGNTPLFGHLEENFRRFHDLGFSVAEELGIQSTSGDDKQLNLFNQSTDHPDEHHQWIKNHLFKRSFPASQRRHLSSVTLAKAKDRRLEVELICKIIKQLLTDDPAIDPSRICVATYKPQIYTSVIREAFVKFGIPVNVTDRFELSESQVVVSVIALLELAVGGLRRDDLLRVLSSPYLDLANQGAPLGRENLSKVSLELRLTVGSRFWQKKIEQRITALSAEQTQGGNETHGKRIAMNMRDLVRAKDDLLFLDTLLHDIAVEQTPAAFEQSLLTLMSQLRIVERILSLGVGLHSHIIEKDSQAYETFLSVVHQTVTLLEYQRGKEARHSLKFYLDHLTVAVAEERYNLREQFGRGVLVTSIDETRGLPLDIMIVAGLVDGEFPSIYQSELFFSNQRLKEREQHHIWENRYLFYQAITNWTRHLYLTFPEQDDDLDLVRSSFVDALENICNVQQWEYPGNTPLDAALYSHEEYIKQFGASLNQGATIAMNVPDTLAQHAGKVEHAIMVEQSRVSLGGLPEYQGEIFDAVSKEAQDQLAHLKNRVYSVSQLESYGKCPFQFFAGKILRLNTVEDLEEEFSALDKGSVVHEILFEFYTERRENNLPPLRGCTEKEFVRAHQRLLAIAERILNAIEIPDAFWELEKELLLGDTHTRRGLLRHFLEFECSRSTTFLPQFFEVGFGNDLGAQTRIDSQLASAEPITAGSVKLRGKVDRVEVSDDAFTIVDYKTGSVIPKLDDIREGISLQLPIYLYTIEKLLAEKLGRDVQPAAGLYYQLRNTIDMKTGVGSLRFKDDLGLKLKSGFLPSDSDLRNMIEDSIAYVNGYVERISHGNFPLTTHDRIDKVCTYCDYKSICRIQSVRRVQSANREA